MKQETLLWIIIIELGVLLLGLYKGALAVQSEAAAVSAQTAPLANVLDKLSQFVPVI